ncbi:MAG TPA: ATP synthase subunit I [Terriglobales bacterium]|nr:ATP synthase subunit I [Terriglobales bacterium]
MTTHPDAEELMQAPADPVADAFYAGAYRRIQFTILVLGGVVSLPAFYMFGWRGGCGFLLGAAIAYINFLWLKQSILALTDRVASQQMPPQGRAMVFKFFFRYALIGAVAYVIISSSAINVLGVIAGFFLSVIALLAEAAVEVVYALRHDK